MTWQFEQLAKLDGITEGPLWLNDMLFFTHIAGNRIMQYRPGSGVGEVCGGTEASNGLMADRDGNIYVCVGGGRRIARHHRERGLRGPVPANWTASASTAPTTWPSTAGAASGSPIPATGTTGTTWNWTTSRSCA